ncbi:hypothetical protein NPIL_452291 [Nephila pilipes]|uniref:Uncharacterized protein n=1 Tax=Nephila pilipes TaxID=299642 RepID=A0A8X6IAM5_NEPPI|nr:hypothetical protein NPIL_452291 [Nephila pilipes]
MAHNLNPLSISATRINTTRITIHFYFPTLNALIIFSKADKPHAYVLPRRPQTNIFPVQFKRFHLRTCSSSTPLPHSSSGQSAIATNLLHVPLPSVTQPNRQTIQTLKGEEDDGTPNDSVYSSDSIVQDQEINWNACPSVREGMDT